MAQAMIATNKDAKITLTLFVPDYSEVTFKKLSDMGFAIRYRIPELRLLIGEIQATKYMAVKGDLAKLATPSPPAMLELL